MTYSRCSISSFIFLLISGVSAFSFQANASVDASTVDKETGRLRAFGGLSSGLSTYNSDAITGLKGWHLNVFGMGSYYRGNWVYDASLGWQHNSMKGTFQGARRVTVETNAGTFELSPRYRFGGSRWQLGPVATLTYGAKVDYSPATGTNGNSASLLGGVKAAYEMPIGQRDLRFTARVQADSRISSQRFFLFLLGAEMSIFAPKVFKASPQSPVVLKPVVEEQKPVLTPETFVYTIPSIHFGSNSAKMDESSKARLRKLAGVLLANSPLWKKIEVNGHTDRFGEESFNLKLSERRAEAVRALLVSEGLPAERLESHGFGESQPVDRRELKEAYAQNRRTELAFSGVKDIPGLKEVLESEKK